MQKQKKLGARILSLVLTATMAFTTLPATAFAIEGDVPAQEQCSCDVLCTEDNTNTDCTVCKAADADLTACRGSAPTPIAPFAEENGGLQDVYIDGSGWNDSNGEGYYEGDDTFDGKTPQEPVQSFTKAAELVAPGGTIWCISTNVVTDTQTWDLSGKPGVTIKHAGTSGDIMVTVMESGNLTIKGIVLDGENKESQSALVNIQDSGQLIMDSGSVIRNNNTTTGGGGVAVMHSGTLTMKDDATISDNHTTYVGGGIAVYTETATVNITENATVTGNASGMDGAGIYVFGTMNMSGGTISGNTAGDTGGGIFINKSATANFTGGSVKENVANASGGAGAGNDIYSNKCSNWTISGDWKPSEGILLNGAAYLTISSALKHPIALEQIRKADNVFIDTVVAKGTDDYTLTQDDVLKFSCKNPQIGFELDTANNQIKLVKLAYAGTQATAPTATRTHDTVTLHTQTIDGETVEYAKSTTSAAPTGDENWQTEVAFTGLTVDTTYYFFARVKENDTHQAGTTSDATAIKTKHAPTTVSGTVKNSKGVAVSGATVTLTPSNPKITATTGADGAYTLSNVPEDTYRLEVKNGNTIITDKITVAGTAITDKDMQFLDGNKNTVVESKPNTPEVAVGGMNDLLTDANIDTTLTQKEKTAVDASGSVELKFTADLKATTDADKGNIEAIAGNQKIDLLLDLSVKKTVKDSTGATVTDGEKVTTLAKIIEIHLPIPVELQGKAGLSLYRMHDGKPEALRKDTPDGNGEYYTIDPSGEFMTLHVKNFSTYAMGYNAFTVTVSGGGTGASGKGNYSNGDTVTINAGSKSGYSFNGWTVTPNTVVLANPSSTSTTFVMPAEAVTVTAGWTSTGGGNPGGGGGNDGGSTTTTYPNTAKQPENGTVTMTPASPSKGQTVTITTKPDAGYVVDTILVKDADGKTIAVTEKGANSYTFTQPTGKVTVEVTYTKAQTGASFTDVTANDWCYDAIMKAIANGWFNGTSATTFSPKAPTTRGMIATILHRMEGTPKVNAASFNDVAAADCFANGVAWAQANGIVQGYGNGNYGPNNSIAREQLAAILYRYAGYKGYDVSKTAALGGFADASDVSGYAEEAMGWAVGNGILSGRGDNTLAPNGAATRAEVATILVRFAELFAK